MVDRVYQARSAGLGDPPQGRAIYQVMTADGACLAVRRIGEGRRGPPVILTHGMFSDMRICVPFARYLELEGFACWTFDWRGHGRSTAGKSPPTFDQVAALDVPAVISFVRERAACERVAWVAHSGGGLALLMHLARVPKAAEQISCGVLFGSQAVGAAATLPGRVFVTLCSALNGILRRVTGPRLRFHGKDEFAGILGPWLRWNRTGRWLGEDGFDYEAGLAGLGVALLVFAGSGDRWIAPPEGCTQLVRAIAGPRNKLIVCAPENGFSEHYSHAGMILSPGARKEIWPRAAAFLKDSESS